MAEHYVDLIVRAVFIECLVNGTLFPNQLLSDMMEAEDVWGAFIARQTRAIRAEATPLTFSEPPVEAVHQAILCGPPRVLFGLNWIVTSRE